MAHKIPDQVNKKAFFISPNFITDDVKTAQAIQRTIKLLRQAITTLADVIDLQPKTSRKRLRKAASQHITNTLNKHFNHAD